MSSKILQLQNIPSGREGWVYLIHAVGTDRYKIGRSVNPVTRLETLKGQSPYPLRVIDSFWTIDAYADESELHQEFLEKRIHGEWFCFTERETEFPLPEFGSITAACLAFGFTETLILEVSKHIKVDRDWLHTMVVRLCFFASNRNDFNRISAFMTKVASDVKTRFTYGCSNHEISNNYLFGLFDGFSFALFNRGVFDYEWQP